MTSDFVVRKYVHDKYTAERYLQENWVYKSCGVAVNVKFVTR